MAAGLSAMWRSSCEKIAVENEERLMSRLTREERRTLERIMRKVPAHLEET